VDGHEGIYRIGEHTASSTSFELDGYWPNASVSGGSFSVFKLDYELLSDHIVIDSTNNKINFKKTSGGSELTATLSSGVYTPAQLATQVGTQMTTTASGPTITCTYSAITKVFTIVSDGAGSTTILPLFATGTNQKQSAHKTLGFDDYDSTAALTHVGVYVRDGIARLIEPFRIQRGERMNITGLDKESFERAFPPNEIMEGLPTKFAVIKESDAGELTVRFNRYPEEKTRIEIDYISVPRDLKDNAGSIPRVPRKHVDVLEDAASFYLMLIKHDDRADSYGQLVKGKLMAMVNQHRGQLLRSGENFGQIIPRRDNLEIRRRRLFPDDPY
jgi:hypothetical protein